MAELLRPAEVTDANRAQSLVDAALKRDGRDNTTALVIQAG